MKFKKQRFAMLTVLATLPIKSTIRPTRSTKASRRADIGLTHKEIHEARIIRDAEVAEPGIVRRTRWNDPRATVLMQRVTMADPSWPARPRHKPPELD